MYFTLDWKIFDIFKKEKTEIKEKGKREFH